MEPIGKCQGHTERVITSARNCLKLTVNWNLHYRGKNYEDTTDQAHKKQQKEMSKEILAGRCAFSSTAIFFTILHSPHGHSYLLESTKMKAHARLRPKLRHQGAGNFSS